jgi:hypothetical protein
LVTRTILAVIKSGKQSAADAILDTSLTSQAWLSRERSSLVTLSAAQA